MPKRINAGETGAPKHGVCDLALPKTRTMRMQVTGEKKLELQEYVVQKFTMAARPKALSEWVCSFFLSYAPHKNLASPDPYYRGFISEKE